MRGWRVDLEGKGAGVGGGVDSGVVPSRSVDGDGDAGLALREARAGGWGASLPHRYWRGRRAA